MTEPQHKILVAIGLNGCEPQAVDRFFMNHAFGDRFYVSADEAQLNHVQKWEQELAKAEFLIVPAWSQADVAKEAEGFRFIYHAHHRRVPNIGIQMLMEALKGGINLLNETYDGLIVKSYDASVPHRGFEYSRILNDRDAEPGTCLTLHSEFHEIRLPETEWKLEGLGLLSQWTPATDIEIDFGMQREWDRTHEMWVDLLLALGRSYGWSNPLPDRAEPIDDQPEVMVMPE